MAVIGSTNVDLTLRVPRHPAPGETLLGSGGHRSPGGKGGNQALAAVLHGADVLFLGAVVDDADAELALSRLRAAGVDTSWVHMRPGTPTGLAVITVADDGENHIVVVSGANGTVTASDVTAWAPHLHDVELVLLQGELPRVATEAAIKASIAAGHRVVLNLAPAVCIDVDLLRQIDVLVVNEPEASTVLAMLGSPPGHAVNTVGGEGQAAALVRSGVSAAVVTLGARGADLADAKGTRHVAAPSVRTVDTTGAGDAFTGALSARLLAGADLAQAGAYAAKVAAFSVQHDGAQSSYPTVEQVQT